MLKGILSYHLSLRPLFCLFLSGRLKKVLLYELIYINITSVCTMAGLLKQVLLYEYFYINITSVCTMAGLLKQVLLYEYLYQYYLCLHHGRSLKAGFTV